MGDKKIVNRECKFITHLPKLYDKRPDTHIIKEILTYEDGTTEPNLRILSNFKRPFWITKPHFQNHKDKKESESIDRLNVYTATQSDMPYVIASRLGSKYVGVKDMRTLSNSPYLYGTDISASTMIKKAYMDKYPNNDTSNKITNLDIEVSIITNELLVISINTDDRISTIINKTLIGARRNVSKQLDYLFDKYVPKTIITEKIEREYIVVENELEVVLRTIKTLHTWKPDYVAIWNITYDMGKILDILEANNISPADVFTDPTLPKYLRYFHFKEGMKSKKTESGKYKPVNIQEQWHTYTFPAHFKLIDAMSLYYYIRVNDKLVSGGYSLDNILKHNLGDELGKIKFKDEVDIFPGTIEWHNYMVSKKPLEYIIYNNWDVISMTHLDMKTNDMRNVMTMLSGVSSLDIFNSGPKRIMDALHFFYLDRGKVLSTKAANASGEKLLGLSDWIVLLPSYRIKENGAMLIEGSTVRANTRTLVGDADQVSAYPGDGQAANVSKETTSKEILEIEGIEKDTFMLQNINIIMGPVNALEYGSKMFNLLPLTGINNELRKNNLIK